MIESDIQSVLAMIQRGHQLGVFAHPPPDAVSYFHICFQRKRDIHTIDLLVALIRGGVDDFDIQDAHGHTALRRAELTSSWWTVWYPQCADILAACSDNVDEQKRRCLTTEVIREIRFGVYFERDLLSMLLAMLE